MTDKKTYIITGENIQALEEILEQHEIPATRYKHFDVLSVETNMEYEHLQELCLEYHIHEQKTDYDISKS